MHFNYLPKENFLAIEFDSGSIGFVDCHLRTMHLIQIVPGSKVSTNQPLFPAAIEHGTSHYLAQHYCRKIEYIFSIQEQNKIETNSFIPPKKPIIYNIVYKLHFTIHLSK